ncbi:MAG: hypothetical protein ACPGTU_04625 [Myxococcota bacterium]
MHWFPVVLISSMMIACSSKENDTGQTKNVGPSCDGGGTTSVEIGTGAGAEFNPLSDGDTVSLVVAPQGGFGVSVRAQTSGLKADDLVDVLLVTEIDGVQSGEYLNESVQLYCQEDSGNGLLWGVVVGFDPDTFASNDDLLALNGVAVDLVVTVYDANGGEETGRVTTIVEVGG